MNIRINILLLFFACNLICIAQSLKVEYLANEGIIISHEDYKIAIDACFSNGLGIYEQPSVDQIDSMKNSLGRFKNITHILVSHNHSDHFDPNIVNSVLFQNPDTKLIASDQVIDFIDPKLKQQTISINPRPQNEWVTIKDENVEIKAAWMLHPYKKNVEVVNLVFHITIDGQKFLHLGDADPIDGNFKELNLETHNYDIAFIPFWFLVMENGRHLVKTYLRSNNIHLIHVQKGFDLNGITKTFNNSAVRILRSFNN